MQQIVNLTRYTKLQQEEPLNHEELEQQRKMWFGEFKPEIKTQSLDDFEAVEQLATKDAFFKLASDVAASQKSKCTCLKPLIAKELVLKVLSAGENILQLLPNVERLELPTETASILEIQGTSCDVANGIVFYTPDDSTPEQLKASTMRPSVVVVGDTHGTFEVLE